MMADRVLQICRVWAEAGVIRYLERAFADHLHGVLASTMRALLFDVKQDYSLYRNLELTPLLGCLYL
jgi:hypothetical protein